MGEEVIDDLFPEVHSIVSHSHGEGQIASFTMGFRIATLFKAPEVNPITLKARSIPFFNLVNIYGRVFFFSWFGFFVAFWSWYAFPPLLHDTIQKDLKLTNRCVQLQHHCAYRHTAGPSDCWTVLRQVRTAIHVRRMPPSRHHSYLPIRHSV